jgi:hypothetical protein
MTSKHTPLAAFSLLALFLAYEGWTLFFSNASAPQEVKRRKIEERELLQYQTALKAISAFSSKYNAIVDWNKGLLRSEIRIPYEDYKDFFTIELQEALLNTQDRPVVLIGEIKDITLQGGKAVIRVSANSSHPDIYYDLVYRGEVLKKITSLQNASGKRYDTKFAIVAQINSVKKVRFSANAEFGGEGVYVSDGDIYLAAGEFIDSMELEEK